ncbi:serine/threonine-protein kinase [Gordonia alkaliphila]|uniref:non-specific serine/threonine protein kinase n=1 Tax=Gordonia alkaliphila TaxID=1053547 RepID=A0ABP8ZC96_9ACTN
MTDSRVGTVFGPYRIEALIGRGGMGAVYRAYDTVHDREVALKLLGGTGTDDGTFAERFRRECRLVARLGEPHIIPIHDFGAIDGTLYLDMRLVEGENLRQVLRRVGPLPAEDAVAFAEQVGEALSAAHASHLVHRDVKPENILVTPTGFAYLVDFGIAHDGTDSGLTKAGTAIGSTAYLAPEHFDNAPVAPSSDVYALAAVLFEMLTGRPPFGGETVSSIIKAAVLQDAPTPSSLNPDVPPALDAVLARGLAKDPARRYASAAELTAAARAALSQESATEFIQVAPPTQPYAGTEVAQTPVYSEPLGYAATQQSGPLGYPQPVGYPSSQATDSGGGRTTQMVLVGFIGLLVAALIGLAVYYFGFANKNDDATAASPSTTTLTSTMTTEPGGQPTQLATTACNSAVGIGSSVTSCDFAQSVLSSYLAAGPAGQSRVITAFSPVTGQSYQMACSAESGIIVCRGGNDAVVHIY